MKKLFAILLALVLALSVTACGSNDKGAELVGTWRYEMDISEYMNDQMAQALGGETVPDTAMSIFLTMTFNEDGTFLLDVDADATGASFDAYMQALKPAMMEMIYQQGQDAGLTHEEFDAALAEQGTSVENLLDSIFAMIDMSSMLETLEGTSSNGYYKVAGGKLFAAENADDLGDDTGVAYAVSGNTMSWNDPSGIMEEYEESGITISLPMVWEKQA